MKKIGIFEIYNDILLIENPPPALSIQKYCGIRANGLNIALLLFDVEISKNTIMRILADSVTLAELIERHLDIYSNIHEILRGPRFSEYRRLVTNVQKHLIRVTFEINCGEKGFNKITLKPTKDRNPKAKYFPAIIESITPDPSQLLDNIKRWWDFLSSDNVNEAKWVYPEWYNTEMIKAQAMCRNRKMQLRLQQQIHQNDPALVAAISSRLNRENKKIERTHFIENSKQAITHIKQVITRLDHDVNNPQSIVQEEQQLQRTASCRIKTFFLTIGIGGTTILAVGAIITFLHSIPLVLIIVTVGTLVFTGSIYYTNKKKTEKNENSETTSKESRKKNCCISFAFWSNHKDSEESIEEGQTLCNASQ